MFAALYAPGNFPILLACAQRFSPLIEITSQDFITFDVRGTERLFGPPAEVVREIERTVGVPAQIALAPNPDTALYLSRGSAGPHIVFPGEEAAALAPLSLHNLGCPAHLGEILQLWGVQTFGQFGDLPPLGIAERCGQEGIYWQRHAQGKVSRQLRLTADATRFHREESWDKPVSSLDQLLFVAGKLLFELCGELTQHSLAAIQIDLQAEMDQQEDHLAVVRLPVPMSDRKTLLKLIGNELESRPILGSVRALRLELTPAKPKAAQQHFFTATYPFPDQLELTVARLRRIVGADNIGTPVLLNTHHPEGFTMEAFQPSPQGATIATYDTARLAFRRFRPPHPAKVKFDQRPLSLSSLPISGAISFCRGPWYSSGHWWRSDAWQREEWDIALTNGAVFKIYRDFAADAWFIEGSYD